MDGDLGGLRERARSGAAALVLAMGLVALPAPAAGPPAEAPLPWGDQGDGSYRNPVLDADYSDGRRRIRRARGRRRSR
jgi:hypothetical protein